MIKKTLRDEFALKYIASILASDRFDDYADEEDLMEAISKDAYLMADAMILSRGKEKTQLNG